LDECFEPVACVVDASGKGKRVDQPTRAEHERPFLARRPVVTVVPTNEDVTLEQTVLDRLDRVRSGESGS
jgi:hypothetical protein